MEREFKGGCEGKVVSGCSYSLKELFLAVWDLRRALEDISGRSYNMKV